jgi:N-methylhydantoinase A
MPPEIRCLGVDVGGTFTDFFLLTDAGLVVYKRPSTPAAPEGGLLEGLTEMGASPEEVVHGSTVATNAIIERKGARTALITTRGFKDVLVIGRQDRPRLYDLSPQREPPLVPDELRLEAAERVDSAGGVLAALDPGEVERLLDEIERAGVESLAVCFLFSFLNRKHEKLVGRAAARRGIPVSLSHEILPEHREYERTSTTVANAYVAPVMGRYLSALESKLAKRGVRRLRVMASNGGSMSAGGAGRLAVRTAVSGPAAGVMGALEVARAAGFRDIVTFDMGGTSTDVSLCPGRISYRDETRVGAFPVRGPTVDVISVGAGGGSIARIDAGGALTVGPESAGADPGPACYGEGMEPTVTDAQVVLGRIVPEFFLGGRMAIYPELSRRAMEGIASSFGGSVERAAAAVLRVANVNMEGALRVVSVERGHDPREFTLVAFGGAGPLHACDLAASLGVRRVLVPRYPGVLSALGMATAPVVKEAAGAVMERFLPERRTASRLGKTLGDLERRARRELRQEGFEVDRAATEFVLDVRYKGQSYELPVATDSADPAVFLPRFHAAHEERYAHSDPSRAVEVVTARARLTIPGAPLPKVRRRNGRRPPLQPVGVRPVSWEGPRGVRRFDTPFYDRAVMKPGHTFEGPAVVVQMDSTVAVPAGWRGAVDGGGCLVVAS